MEQGHGKAHCQHLPSSFRETMGVKTFTSYAVRYKKCRPDINKTKVRDVTAIDSSWLNGVNLKYTIVESGHKGN